MRHNSQGSTGNGFPAGAGDRDFQNERGWQRECAENGNKAGNGNLNTDLIQLFYQWGIGVFNLAKLPLQRLVRNNELPTSTNVAGG